MKIKKPGRMPFLMGQATVVVLMGVYGLSVFSPLIRQCDRTRRQVGSLRRRISLIGEWRASSGGRDASGSLQANVKPQSDLAEALSQLQSLGQATGLTILSIQPKALKKSQPALPYQTTLIELDARGSEMALRAFLSRLKTCGFLCQVNRLRIAADRSEERILLVRATLEKIDVLDVPAEAPYAAASQQDDEKTFSVKRTRSLFKSPQRNVVKIVSAAGDDQAQVIKNLSLVGIIEDNGRKAVLEDRRSAKTHFVRESDVLAGLVIKEISQGAVVLEAAGEAYRLDL
ncbi:MAG: hypothetical protein V1863_02975 [Candidatus Omnitrophota bacterium]